MATRGLALLSSILRFPRRDRLMVLSRRKALRGAYLEALEARQLLSVTLAYGGSGTALTLSESVSGATTVTISEVSANDLRINLNGGTFSAGSSAAGGVLTYQTGTASTSAFADINITNADAITTLQGDLIGDLVNLGTINDTNGGLGNINLAGGFFFIPTGTSINTTAATAGTGNIALTAETFISINSGATLQTKDGSITLLANAGSTPTGGNAIAINNSGGTLKTTGAGSILLEGTGTNDATTGSHIGILFSAGATAVATGTGGITLIGTGGLGVSGNFGVDLTGTNTKISSAARPIVISGTGGTGLGPSSFDVGEQIASGAQVAGTGTATVSISGTGGQGTGSDMGVNISGSGTVVSSASTLKITGTGGGIGLGTVEAGVDIGGAAQVTASGALTIAGTGGLGVNADFGVVLDGTSGTQVSSPASVTVTGTGGGIAGGVNEFGVLLDNGIQVSSTGSVNVTGSVIAGTSGVGVDVTSSARVGIASGTVLLAGDSMTLDASATIAGSVVTIQPLTAGLHVDVGGANAAGTLGLAVAGIDSIATPVLRIGSTTTGPINISGAIVLPNASAPVLSLINDGAVTETGSIVVGGLAINSPGPVTLPGGNLITTLAAGVGGAFSISDFAALTLGTVDGIAGVTTGGNFTLTVSGVGLTLGSGAGEDISTTADVDIHANGMTEAVGSIVTAGRVRLRGFGTFALANANVVGVLASNTVGAITFQAAGDLLIDAVGSTTGVLAAQGDVSLTATGNLTLAYPVSDQNGLVLLKATTGALTSTGIPAAIVAASLIIPGVPQFGSAAVPISTEVGTVAGSSGGGGFFMNNIGSLVVGTVAGTSGIVCSGLVTINASGALTVSNVIAGGGSVILSGSGAININGVVVGTTATVLGGAGDDVITVSVANSAVPLTINGGGGTDSYVVDFGALLSPVDIAPGAGTNTLTINGLDEVQTFDISSTQVGWSGSQTVNYSDIQQLIVNGGSASDTFNVSPSATTAMSVNGNDPTAPTTPADTLTVDPAGTTGYAKSDTVLAGSHSGTLTFTNRKAIAYTGMETVSALLAVTPAPTAFTASEVASTPKIVLATFTDPNGAGAASSYSASVDWGDGTLVQIDTAITFSAATKKFTLTGTHTYATPGTYTPTIVIHHTGIADSDAVTDTVHVNVVPITGQAVTFNGTVGQPLSAMVARFTTKRTTASVVDYTATIDWGDGNTTAGTIVKDATGKFHVTGTHTYAAVSAPTYHVLVTIQRSGAAETVIHSSAKITAAGLSHAMRAAIAAPMNTATDLTLGTFLDANTLAADPASYRGTIVWADGTTSAATFVKVGDSAVGTTWEIRGTHAYRLERVYHVKITMQDIGSPARRLTLSDTITAS